MKAKVLEFVEKHGYTVKAFIISLIVFPPGAVFIALKHPTWSFTQKAIALICFIASTLFVLLGGGALIAGIIENTGEALSSGN